ncbi:hypothetical protein B0H17DRAFT_1338769 [Mycena rosella]|uniref:Uncharacterized protein n=1 Tax=Mycena rosella TaxID=1033263 RepID=A0AAD7CHI7_MYCRO|nr:hypothetical protein B0H17DRAFT_1338769 [Mycena rosella]
MLDTWRAALILPVQLQVFDACPCQLRTTCRHFGGVLGLTLLSKRIRSGDGSSCLLFFFRVRAVYGASRLVTAAFGLLWLGVLGTALTVPLGGDAIPIGPTDGDDPRHRRLPGTLVANTYAVHTHTELFKAFFTGAYLSSFSKALLVDDQIY